MANLNVTYGDIEEAVSKLKSGQSDLVNKLNELKAMVDGLVSGGFVTDKASGAFQQSYEQFTKGATETVNGLEGMQSFLTKTKEAMSQLDSDLAAALNNS